MAIITYSRTVLLSIIFSKCFVAQVDCSVWLKLKGFGLNKSLTRRGCRAGVRKQRPITSLIGLGKYSNTYLHYKRSFSSFNNLHSCQTTINPNLIYIQVDNNITNDFNKRTIDSTVNQSKEPNPINIRSEFVPGLILSNTMSLAPKIDEIRYSVLQNNVDFASFTETWLSDSVGDNAIQIPGYNVVRKDRLIGQHGGVCLYIKASIPYEVLDQFHHPALEVLWVKTRPHRLPRGLSCIIVGTVYHPPSAHAETMINFLLEQLASMESTYSNCGFIILGDFNNLDVGRIKNQFRLKQLIQFHTRGNRTLDLILTNLKKYYQPPVKLPPFGLSDHFTVLAEPKIRGDNQLNKKTKHSRDLRSKGCYECIY